MTTAYTYPLSGSIQNMNAYSHVIRIVPIDCTPTCLDTVLAECDSKWNCQQQSKGALYYTPVLDGDSFMFQLQFLDRWNDDPSEPEEGWGGWGNQVVAELYNYDGTLLSDDHTDFSSRFLVGWDGTKSYQLIEINFDLLKTNFPDVSCFYFKFIAQGAAQDVIFETDSVCSQDFQYIPGGCPDTILIESTGQRDCCGNYYGLPVAYIGSKFAYSNKWRYYASIRQTNVEFEKTRFGTKRPKVELDRNFTLQLRRKIPPYLFKQLAEIHLAGNRVFVDEVEYFIDAFSFNNESEGKMFIGRFDLFQECDSNYQCN